MKIKFISVLLVLLMINSAYAAVHLAPSITSKPNDITIEESSTGNTVQWIAVADESGDSPADYIIRVNSSILSGHNEVSWQDNVPIVLNVDDFVLGVHNVEIEVRDSGYPDQAVASFDTVVVTVVEDGSLPESSESSVSDSSSTTPISDTGGSTPSDDGSVNLSASVFFVAIVTIPMLRLRRR